MIMILPKPQDAFHKMQLYRLLTEILDNPVLAQKIYFKGGTCASMLGFLDRFSVDLDFDLADSSDKKTIDVHLRRIFQDLGFSLRQKSRGEPLYIVSYQAKARERNSIKLSLLPKTSPANIYQPFYLAEIDRYAICQTIETMFANKLVSLTDRYKKYKTIAGRDLYDIHHFFLNGYLFLEKVVEERTGKDIIDYLTELINFIDTKINEKVISQDLNYLLPYDNFRILRKVLKKETILFLKDEIKRRQTKS